MKHLDVIAQLFRWRGRVTPILAEAPMGPREPGNRCDYLCFDPPAGEQMAQARFYENAVNWSRGTRVERTEGQKLHGSHGPVLQCAQVQPSGGRSWPLTRLVSVFGARTKRQAIARSR